MTRSKVMSGLLKIIQKKSIVFCVGTELIGESKFENYPGFIGVTDIYIDYLAVALGIAMASTHKVVVICDDAYLLSHLTTLSQIGVSECTNLYIIFFRTGSYGSGLIQPTITSSIRSIKGVLFNFGILVHDYTPYFKDNSSIKMAAPIFNKSLGPLVVSMDIDNQKLYNKGNSINDWSVFADYLLSESGHVMEGGVV